MRTGWTRGLVIVAAGMAAGASSALAQAATPADSAARDSLFRCARREATAAGFRPTPTQRPGRLALMRVNDTPGPRYPLDALSFRAEPDSTGRLRLTVRVTTFMVPRDGFGQEEVAPRASLTALAERVRDGCNGAAP